MKQQETTSSALTTAPISTGLDARCFAAMQPVINQIIDANGISYGISSDLAQKMLKWSQIDAAAGRGNFYANEIAKIQAANRHLSEDNVAKNAAISLMADLSEKIRASARATFGFNDARTEADAFYMAAEEWHTHRQYKKLTSYDIDMAFRIAAELKAKGDTDLTPYGVFTMDFFHRVLGRYLVCRAAVLSAYDKVAAANSQNLLAAGDTQKNIAELNEKARQQFADTIAQAMQANELWRRADDIPAMYCSAEIAKILAQRQLLVQPTKEEWNEFIYAFINDKINIPPKTEIAKYNGWLVTKIGDDPNELTDAQKQIKADYIASEIVPAFVRQRIFDKLPPYSGRSKQITAENLFKAPELSAEQLAANNLFDFLLTTAGGGLADTIYSWVNNLCAEFGADLASVETELLNGLKSNPMRIYDAQRLTPQIYAIIEKILTTKNKN